MKIENFKMDDINVFCTTRMAYSYDVLTDFSIKFHHDATDDYRTHFNHEFRGIYENGICIRFIAEYRGDGFENDHDEDLFVSRCAIFEYDMQNFLKFSLSDAKFKFESGKTGSLIVSGVMISASYFIYNFFKDYNDVRAGVIRFSKDVSNGCRLIGNMMSDKHSVERRRQILEREDPYFENNLDSMKSKITHRNKNII